MRALTAPAPSEGPPPHIGAAMLRGAAGPSQRYGSQGARRLAPAAKSSLRGDPFPVLEDTAGRERWRPVRPRDAVPASCTRSGLLGDDHDVEGPPPTRTPFPRCAGR